MASRGQNDFASLPRFAAGLYSILTRTRGIQTQHSEIASELARRQERGKVLDVGTGPGTLLIELDGLNPALELFGLDVSRSMVELASKRLHALGAKVRQGDIRHSGYDDNFFDLVTCTGSFYLWDTPVQCLDEIFRILKPHRSACLYETYSDCDRSEVRAAIQANLKGEALFRRVLAPWFFAKQLRMTYTVDEVSGIVRQTRFAQAHTIERIRLAGVPAWLRITLTKEG
jgi:ubiquinone/menaquinone biosynthesis C-methylase UbiE